MSTVTPNDNYPAYLRFIASLIKKISSQRPLAYASEVGEASRPLVNKWVVRSAYGLSFAYVFADIGIKTYEVKNKGKDAMKWKALDLGIWHTFASMFVPAVTIHTIVKVSSNNLKKFPSVLTRLPRFGKFIPSIIGLLSIPLIIHPIDHATDFVIHIQFPVTMMAVATV
jgi:fission process protein 1